MEIEVTKTVAELASALPGATRVFEKLGIDYCCGGTQSLGEACHRANVKVDSVVRSLEEAERGVKASAADSRDWRKEPLSSLASYIVNKHHRYTKEEIARVEPLLAKVCSVHGKNHPEVGSIQTIFGRLARELESHMYKEEQILFPYVARLEEATALNLPAPPCPFGTVRNPIRMMMLEHDDAGTALRELRTASADYKVPPDACTSYRALYEALETFEADLHQHIHLENNILFPRAADTESRSQQ